MNIRKTLNPEKSQLREKIKKLLFYMTVLLGPPQLNVREIYGIQKMLLGLSSLKSENLARIFMRFLKGIGSKSFIDN